MIISVLCAKAWFGAAADAALKLAARAWLPRQPLGRDEESFDPLRDIHKKRIDLAPAHSALCIYVGGRLSPDTQWLRAGLTPTRLQLICR